MPSRCIFIATTNLPAQIPTQPKSPRQRRPVHESTWPHPPQPMPQQSSCEAKLGRENSILARHNKAQQQPEEEGPAAPLPQTRLFPIVGSRNSLLCFACLLAGRYEINTFTWPTMTRSPAALRNLVKLERRRGVALVIARRARNPRRAPIAGNTTSKQQQLPSRHPVVGKGKRLGWRRSVQQQAAAKPQSHDGIVWHGGNGFLALGKCA